ESKLLKDFPPIFMKAKKFKDPAIVTDCNGCILLWYLPGLFLEETQTALFQSINSLEKSLKVVGGQPSSWRTSNAYFQMRPEWLKPGNVTLSPTWFQQAHEVTQKSNKMEVSKALRKEENISWLETNINRFALFGAVLSVTQPDLYFAGCQTLEAINKASHTINHAEYLPAILSIWASPYTVINVISNRETPVHHDNGSGYSCLDTLLALGTYSSGVFHLPSLGMQLAYLPRTVIYMASRVLPHAASCDGNQACVAFYMRQNVMNALDITCPEWGNINRY
ncbi:hypothetical protein CPC08DRAFT_592016, partial [Agrocybe pediades]